MWRVTGQRHLGLIAAGWSGRIVTLAVVYWFAVRPLLEGRSPSLLTIAWMGLVGAFLWFGAGQAINTGRLRGRLARLDVRAVTHPVVAMARAAPLTAIPRVSAQAAQRGVVVAILDDDGTPLGILDGEAVEEAMRAGDERAPADSCLRLMPPAWVLDLPQESADLSPAIDALVEHRLPLLLLREPGGEPWGALDGGTVGDIATGAKAAP